VPSFLLREKEKKKGKRGKNARPSALESSAAKAIPELNRKEKEGGKKV